MTTRVSRVFFVLLAACLLLAGPALAQQSITKVVYDRLGLLVNVDYAGGICFMAPDTFLDNTRFIPKIVHLSATGTLTTAITPQDVSGLGQFYDFYTGSPYSNAKSIACNENGTVWAMVADKRYQIGNNPYGAMFQKAPNQPKEFMFEAFKPVSISSGQTGYAAGLDSIYAGFGRMEMWGRLTESPTGRTAYGYVGRLTGYNQTNTIFSTKNESLGDLYYHFTLTKNATWIPVKVTSSNYWKMYRFSLTGDRTLALEGFTPTNGEILGIANNSTSLIMQNLNKGEVEYVQINEAGGAPQVFRGLPAAEFQALTESGVHYILTQEKKLYRRLPGQTKVEEIPLAFKPVVIVASKDRVYLTEYVVGRVEGKIYELIEQTKPILTISANLPEVQAGQSYSRQLAVAGGTPPYSWSLVSGSLPSGLSLSRTGLVSGITYAPGTYTFTVEVSDSAGNKAQTQVTLTVSATTLVPEITSVRLGAEGTLDPSAVGPGTYVTLYGKNFFPNEVRPDGAPLPKSVRGAAVDELQLLINGIPAPLQYVSDEQINFILPKEVNGNAKIEIVKRGSSGEVRSKPYEVQVRPTGGAFAYASLPKHFPGDTPRPIAIISNTDGSVPQDADTKSTGNIGTAWLTGSFRLSEDIPAGDPAPPNRLVYVTNEYELWMQDIHGMWRKMKIHFFGAAPGFAGLFQLNFEWSDTEGRPVEIKYGETVLRIKEANDQIMDTTFYVRGNVE